MLLRALHYCHQSMVMNLTGALINGMRSFGYFRIDKSFEIIR